MTRRALLGVTTAAIVLPRQRARGAGDDVVATLKAARAVGVVPSIQVVGMFLQGDDVQDAGLVVAQGALVSESVYRDLNEGTRAFAKRIRAKAPNALPPMRTAGNYAATLHYLKAAADIGVAAAKADGAAVVVRMKAMPIDDDCFGPGRIRADGREIHPSYLFRVVPGQKPGGEQKRLGFIQARRDNARRPGVPASFRGRLPAGQA
jgi:branched-chain amino acid transport system substrate-binding protein